MTFQALPSAQHFEELAAEQALAPLQRPIKLGVHLVGDGVDVAVTAGHATRVEICFFDHARPLTDANLLDGLPAMPAAAAERRYELKQELYGMWVGHIPGIQAGAIYGFRAYGPWDPQRGLFYNPAKVMIDPYARAVAQMPALHSSLFAHQVDAEMLPIPGMERSNEDSAPFAALGAVTEQRPDAEHVRVPWPKTVIYEAHVVGLTKRLPEVPEELRGTYAGVAHPTTISYLKRLGVTSLELLPIFANMAEPFLTLKGLTNYWGYNTLNYFSPEPRYATRAAQEAGWEAVWAEVRAMVQLLHEAGIEVILDVVYNHTNEAGVDGVCTSFRGLDHLGYYRYDSSNPGRLIDTTGCGNSLDFRRTAPVRLTLDSLRYWTEKIGIDGYRFDLAVTLGREGDSFDSHHPIFTAALTDPILSSVKLINEPWDVGLNGWQTGNFANGTADWNDRFRDAVRAFWLEQPASIAGGAHGSDLRDMATRISGSADLFGHGRTPDGRGMFASVNFVTAHDGFSIMDLVSFNEKHNEANLEGNRDGSPHNRSWNHGVEGFADVPAASPIPALRRKSVRNMLGTLALAAGTPMLRSGDEILQSQGGNNNTYCQNNDIAWLDWDLPQENWDVYETLAYLLRLRAEHPVLRPVRFYTGTPSPGDTLNDLEWFDAFGHHMPDFKWFDASVRVLQMLRSGAAQHCQAAPELDRDALIIINGSLESVPVAMPLGRERPFELMWSSAWENPSGRDGEPELFFDPGDSWEIPALSLALFFA